MFTRLALQTKADEKRGPGGQFAPGGGKSAPKTVPPKPPAPKPPAPKPPGDQNLRYAQDAGDTAAALAKHSVPGAKVTAPTAQYDDSGFTTNDGDEHGSITVPHSQHPAFSSHMQNSGFGRNDPDGSGTGSKATTFSNGNVHVVYQGQNADKSHTYSISHDMQDDPSGKGL